jgi:hypothetical protein
MDDREWVPVDEASDHTGYSTQYIERLCEEGIVRYGENILGVMMVSMSDLTQYNRELLSHRTQRMGQ